MYSIILVRYFIQLQFYYYILFSNGKVVCFIQSCQTQLTILGMWRERFEEEH
jgi:hypothetical protein